ncbi:MAG: hypothetical protein JWN78_2300 [Bacteroidota bacterium]|nr:hypothetical protein [Bacteroidota bacterium]
MVTTLIIIQACCSKEFIVGDISRNICFLDKTSGYNLLFGVNKVYNKDSIFVRYDNDTFYHIVSIPYNSTDTFVNVVFNNASTCFIKFSNNDVDTFSIQYEEKTAKTAKGICRLSFNEIVSLKYNNVSLNINEDPIKVYKKN